MLYFHLRFSVRNPPAIHVPTSLWPHFGFVVNYALSQPNAMQSNYQISLVKNISPSFVLFSSFTRLHSFRTLQINSEVGETPDVSEFCSSKFSADSSEEQTFNEVVHLDNYSYSSESFVDEHQKEIQRRRRIGLANKGRVPWNKGRKHSAETRERIRQRTIEALRDPKVRKKMSECPRAHSDQSKARIRSSLRRIWGKRSNWKRVRENFILSWAVNLAKAAKKGGSGQQKLEWDSYDKIKEEIALQQLQIAANKAKKKEMAKLRADKAAKAKAKPAQKKREKEEKGEIIRKMRKIPKEDKEGLAIAEGLKLKARLTKIHKKKSRIMKTRGEMVNSQIPAWQKLDLEFIKRERMQKEVSLADQIRVAKNKRAGTMTRESKL